MEARIHELFIPPAGLIRNIPIEKMDEYREKYSKLGPFTRHEYDLDACTMYRQLEDLKGRYTHIGGLPFDNYLEQIKNYVGLALQEAKLDIDFYLNSFYYIIKPGSHYYFSSLGLFFALSDPLKIISLLEYHLEKFNQHNNEEDADGYFLDKLEYLVCNYLRTNRFPEDYFAKHDKIINWIYNKRETEVYRSEINSKLEALISSINKLSPKQNISNEIIKHKPGRKKFINREVFVVQKMVEILIQDLHGYFSKKHIRALRKILNGKAEPSLIVMFDGQANQLIDIFRIYADAKFIEADVRAVAVWICQHFMYWHQGKKSGGFLPFAYKGTERVIYKGNPVGKTKRIPLRGLPKSQEKYYTNKRKSSSDSRSDD